MWSESMQSNTLVAEKQVQNAGFEAKRDEESIRVGASIFCMDLVVFSESRKQKKKTCSLVLCEEVMFNKWAVNKQSTLSHLSRAISKRFQMGKETTVSAG